MTRKISRARDQRRARPAQHIYIPHSSWTKRDATPAAGATIAPDDFWARLGL
ncbi:hypothetical protein Q4610_00695 [Sphingobium sp. HBC34]|uniref:Uncharacterized protein n=1 Tax=Sphingobium cyanobacteriorum TaxID=3063954 RepID=A0ABT8ZG91_9SPHN|nr:hypothetical protein [Sphingobium sp. HBC34]MDO7833554.1 hypothetical protein [Sphingobium sp. HBC34]